MLTSSLASALLQSVGDASPHAILAKDLQLRFTYVNRTFLERVGKEEAELIGRTAAEVFPASALRMDEIWERVLRTGKPVTTRMPPVDFLGKRIDTMFRHFPLLDSEGRIIGAAVIAEDLTREALLAEQNARSALRYRMISEQTPSIVWSCRADGSIDFVSERWQEFVGEYPPDDWGALVHEEDRKEVDDSIDESIRLHQPWRRQFRLKHVSGEYRWVLGRAVAHASADDGLYFGSFTDIHDLVQAQNTALELQAEAAHLARVSDLGNMASALAHELNQPLAAAANYIEGVSLAVSEDSEQAAVRQVLDLASAQVHRAGEIVRRLRGFLRKRPAQRQAEPLEPLIRDAVDLALLAARGERVTIDYRFVAPCEIWADSIQIQQVIANLMRNAIEAMDQSPTKVIRILVRPVPPGRAQITISDSGPGLPAAVATALFAPFRSTKIHGLGIGLSLSRTIVEAHGGRIWAEPPGGSGAEFHIQLPLVAESRQHCTDV